MPRTFKELENQLKIQCSALSMSNTMYHSGNKWEALRLATCVANIVHDGKNNSSLLSQLDIRDKINFIASGYFIPNDFPFYKSTPLVGLQRHEDGFAEFVPVWRHLRQKRQKPNIRLLPVQVWWEEDVIYKEGQCRLTRMQLTKILRDKEGGSHYDPDVNDMNYLSLKQSFVYMSPAGVSILKDVELATMRQIAGELQTTLAFAVGDKRSPEELTKFFDVYPPDAQADYGQSSTESAVLETGDADVPPGPSGG